MEGTKWEEGGAAADVAAMGRFMRKWEPEDLMFSFKVDLELGVE